MLVEGQNKTWKDLENQAKHSGISLLNKEEEVNLIKRDLISSINLTYGEDFILEEDIEYISYAEDIIWFNPRFVEHQIKRMIDLQTFDLLEEFILNYGTLYTNCGYKEEVDSVINIAFDILQQKGIEFKYSFEIKR